MRQLCVRVAPFLPEQAISKMVLELLAAADTSSGNWDAPMAGVRGGGGGGGSGGRECDLLGVAAMQGQGQGRPLRARCTLQCPLRVMMLAWSALAMLGGSGGSCVLNILPPCGSCICTSLSGAHLFWVQVGLLLLPCCLFFSWCGPHVAAALVGDNHESEMLALYRSQASANCTARVFVSNVAQNIVNPCSFIVLRRQWRCSPS